MKLLSIILPILSAIAVLLAIIFEGKLKNSEEVKINFSTLWEEIRLVSPFGWILIALMLLLNFGNSWISYQDRLAQEIQFEKDTLKYTQIITQLEDKRYQDSLRIQELKREVINNGLKSDSIRIQVVDNAVKALDEQRLILERKKENAYKQMVSEVEDNLKKIYINYREKHIRGFLDTTLFISTRLKNEKINEYINMSTRFPIIEHLLETSESIDAVNRYADHVLRAQGKSKSKEMNTNMFLKNVETTKRYLLLIYIRNYTLDSYKQYEALDFSEDIPDINENHLKIMLQIENLIKTTDMKIIFK